MYNSNRNNEIIQVSGSNDFLIFCSLLVCCDKGNIQVLWYKLLQEFIDLFSG